MKTLNPSPIVKITYKDLLAHIFQPAEGNALQLTPTEWILIKQKAKESNHLNEFTDWLNGKFIRII